jgi:phosphoribosylanthranilate isomerase
MIKMMYKNVADIYLFDSKGYEKSMSFNHEFIKNLKLDKELMIAGNIKVEDPVEKYVEIADIVDISGGLETSGLKDISKIDIFLKKIKQISNEA